MIVIGKRKMMAEVIMLLEMSDWLEDGWEDDHNADGDC